MSEIQKQNGGHRLCFRDKACRKLPDFENSALQGFIVKNIECESKEANDLTG